MLNKRLDGNGASKPHGMVKGGNAVLVGSVDVRPGVEQCDEPPPLGSGVWIALAADAGQFVHHQVVLVGFRFTRDVRESAPGRS